MLAPSVPFHREVCGGKGKFRSPPGSGAPKSDAKGSEAKSLGM